MLSQAIGDILPTAVGVAISPVPIIAVILMLGTSRARSTGTAFAVGWVAGLTVVSVVVLLVAGDADDPDSGTSTAVAWIELALGLAFLVMAAKQWAGRPTKGEEPELPGWMQAVDSFTPGKALGLGVVLSALNPKNLALTLAAAASIAQAGLGGSDSAIAVGVFVLIGSVTVAGPVLFFLFATEAAERPLASIKSFMSDYNAVIMFVLLLVLGAKLLGTGIADLGA